MPAAHVSFLSMPGTACNSTIAAAAVCRCGDMQGAPHVLSGRSTCCAVVPCADVPSGTARAPLLQPAPRTGCMHTHTGQPAQEMKQTAKAPARPALARRAAHGPVPPPPLSPYLLTRQRAARALLQVAPKPSQPACAACDQQDGALEASAAPAGGSTGSAAGGHWRGGSVSERRRRDARRSSQLRQSDIQQGPRHSGEQQAF